MAQSHQAQKVTVATGGLSPAIDPPHSGIGNAARVERAGLASEAPQEGAELQASSDHVEAPASNGAGSDVDVQRGGGVWTVKRGDVLWNISKATYGSGVYWKKIKAANPKKVFGESTIHTGAALDLPLLDVPATTAPSTVAGVWTVEKLVALLDQGAGKAALEKIERDRIAIVRFDTAFDIWEHDDGHREEQELTGLRGNTSAGERKIRLRTSLSDTDAVMTLFHELNHWGRPEANTQQEYLDEEVDVRVKTEEWGQSVGIGETRPGYRNADGTPNQQAIKDSVYNSSHYNPTGKHRVGREYVGEIATSGWKAP